MGFVDLLDSWHPLGFSVTSEKSSNQAVGGFSKGKEQQQKEKDLKTTKKKDPFIDEVDKQALKSNLAW